MIEVRPIKNQFLADVTGIDVCQLTDEDFDVIYSACLQFGVLRLRHQAIDEEGLQEFSARFGPLEDAPMGRMSEAERAKVKSRYVTQLSNILVNGKPIGGLGNPEPSWHSDMTYLEVPPPASVLLGIEIPEEGGDTYFADQNAAYMVLPQALKSRAEESKIKHDAAHTSVGGLRRGFEHFDDPRDAPSAVHDVVRTHDETGLKALYLGRREWAYMLGLELEDSEALLDELWQYAAREEYIWQQKWQPNDLIIWDNRRVLHRRDDFDQNARRLMKRCQVLART